jgi:hypothetical protein
VPEPGPLLASAHAALARQLAAVPPDRIGAAIAVVDEDSLTVGFVTRLGEDWTIGGEAEMPLRDPKAVKGQIIVTGTW